MPRKKTDGIVPFVQRYQLQALFLLTCFNMVPELKKEFYEKVYPLLRDLPRTEGFFARIFLRVINRVRGEEDDSSEGERALADALIAWSKKLRHVDTEWVVRPALLALFAIEVPVWDLLSFKPPELLRVFSEEETEFRFVDRGWNPALEDEEGARERMLGALAEEFEGYFDHVRGLAERRGVTPVPQERAKKSSPADRLEWVVRHLVLGEAISDIVEEIAEETEGDSYDPASVRKAIREQATALGMRLPDGRGRPAKKRK